MNLARFRSPNNEQRMLPAPTRVSPCRMGCAKPREDGQKTSDSDAVQAGDLRSRPCRRDPTDPRVSPVHPQTSPPGASLPLRQDYPLAPPLGAAHLQSPPE